jgi:hypothetical protein
MMESNITIKKAVLHIVDNTGGVSVVSDKELILSAEIEEYLTKHIDKCFLDIDVKNTRFIEGENAFLAGVKAYIKDGGFLELSKNIAEDFISAMEDGSEIPSADLVVVEFSIDHVPYLGVLKFNYKRSYIHFVETENGIRNTIVRQPCSLPLETQKLEEFALVNLNDYSIKLKERFYEVKGDKILYISREILKSKGAISEKGVVDMVEKTVKKIVRDSYENDISKYNAFKNTITEDYINNQEINIDNIAESTFEDESGRQAFKEELEKTGLRDSRIKISHNAEKRVLRKQKLVTDTGIEISIPASYLNDSSIVEFINNADGTISITIKNIVNVDNK